MALPFAKTCLYFSLILGFMLFYQGVSARYNFAPADQWLEENTPEMGGRSVLLVFRDGKVIYSKSVNNLSRKQKLIGKMVAKRTGRDAEEVLQDLSPDSKIAIASCSKWLSAARS